MENRYKGLRRAPGRIDIRRCNRCGASSPPSRPSPRALGPPWHPGPPSAYWPSLGRLRLQRNAAQEALSGSKGLIFVRIPYVLLYSCLSSHLGSAPAPQRRRRRHGAPRAQGRHLLPVARHGLHAPHVAHQRPAIVATQDMQHGPLRAQHRPGAEHHGALQAHGHGHLRWSQEAQQLVSQRLGAQHVQRQLFRAQPAGAGDGRQLQATAGAFQAVAFKQLGMGSPSVKWK